MRKGIHPESYRMMAFKDMSTNDVFLIPSTANSKETLEVDGVEYPLHKLYKHITFIPVSHSQI